VHWAADAQTSKQENAVGHPGLHYTNSVGLVRQTLLFGCKRSNTANESAMADLDLIRQSLQMAYRGLGQKSHSLTSNAEEAPECSGCSPSPSGLPPKPEVAKTRRISVHWPPAYLGCS